MGSIEGIDPGQDLRAAIPLDCVCKDGISMAVQDLWSSAMSLRIGAAVVSVFIASSILGPISWAQSEPSGEADFHNSCSGCHGEDGRGGGAKAFGLSVDPPDLTRLQARNGGVFPRARLRKIIDGREDIKIHLDREMPVWGQLFKLDAEEGLGNAEGDEASVKERIERLIDFIGSLQR